MSDTNSESQAAAAAGATPLRLRHRLPKALPNIANLNALARVNRVAETTADKVPPSPVTENAATPAPTEASKPAVVVVAESGKLRKPLTATTNSSDQPSAPSTPTPVAPVVSLPNSPAVHASPGGLKTHSAETLSHLHPPSSHPLSSPGIVSASPVNPALSYKQYANMHGLNSVPMSPASNFGPCTPGPVMPASVYQAKFSNEHIMNIIKHKTLQKLKKIESESLKERRKRYQRESVLYQHDKSHQARLQLINTNSNSSVSSGGGEGSNLTEVSASTPFPVIDRSKLRMRDLLYYSPRTKRKERQDSNEIVLESVNEPAAAANISQSSSSSSLSERRPSVDQPAKATFSAPQLKIAEDGSLILNEESLIIRRAEVEPVFDSTVVENEQNDNLSYNSYRKFHHTKKWSQRETAKFYKALSMIGTDFTMIQRLFSNRSRDEIKRKFKREEKLNQALIDKILSKTSQIDLSVFVASSSEDEEPRARKSAKEPAAPSEDGAETANSPVKKKYDRYNLKRVKKRAFIESESDEEATKTRKTDFESGEFDPNEASKPKTSMKKPQRAAPKGVKKVSFAASGSLPQEPDGEETTPTQMQRSESREIFDTINNVIQTFCHNEQSSVEASPSQTPSEAPAPVEERSAPVVDPLVQATSAEAGTTRMTSEQERPKSPPPPQAETQEEEDEEVIDLIFDVDNDLVQEINETPVTSSSKQTPTSVEAEEENVILDLDNNTFVVNNTAMSIDTASSSTSSNAIKEIEQQERQLLASSSESSRPTRSSITITKRSGTFESKK